MKEPRMKKPRMKNRNFQGMKYTENEINLKKIISKIMKYTNNVKYRNEIYNNKTIKNEILSPLLEST